MNDIVALLEKTQKLTKTRLSLQLNQARSHSKHRGGVLNPMKRRESLAASQVLEILQAPPSERTPDKVRKIQVFTAEIKFFRNYNEAGNPEIHYKCCEKMFHLYLPEGEIVFQQGSVGDLFYIILEGVVSVNINMSMEEEFIENHLGTETLKEVRLLRAGDSFGELALLNNTPRGATIKCKEDCHFAVLQKRDFDRILKYKEELKLSKETRILKETAIFRDWPFQILKFLYQKSYSEFHRLNSKVFTQGEKSSDFYIVVHGVFLISKLVKTHCEDEDDDGLHLAHNSSSEIKISTLGPGNIFGEEDIVFNRNRTFNVTAIKNNCELRVIPSKIFSKYVLKDEYTFNQLLKGAKSKEKFINEATNFANKNDNVHFPKSVQQIILSKSASSLSQFTKLKSSVIKNESDNFLKERIKTELKETSALNSNYQKMFEYFTKQERYMTFLRSSKAFRVKNYSKFIPKPSKHTISTQKSRMKAEDYFPKMVSLNKTNNFAFSEIQGKGYNFNSFSNKGNANSGLKDSFSEMERLKKRINKRLLKDMLLKYN